MVLSGCGSETDSPPARPEPVGADAPDGSMLAPIDLVYVCGNTFIATNATRRAVHLTYRVAGGVEAGELTLPDGNDEDPGHSETELKTRERGAVELYLDGESVARRRNEGRACGAPAVSASIAGGGSPDVAGEWTAPQPWPIVAIHMSLLPDGRVLAWDRELQEIWDPATGSFTSVPSGDNIFCAGQAFLADGRLLVAGGHISNDHGLPDVNLFSTGADAWTANAPMRRGRWYPTVTTLASGEAVILAGRDETGTVVGEPEVWRGGVLRVLSTASRTLPYYPRSFVAPNGRVFVAGEQQTTRYLSTSGTGSWSTVGNRLYGTRDYGAAVMYNRGKILYVGGGRTTNTAEIVDLNAAAPVWQWTGSMAYRRRHLNATVLPTGEVLVTSGTSGTGFNDVALAVHPAEIWNPATGVWTTLASNTVNRAYHSTSILLPDGRVLHGGSGQGAGAPDEKSVEIFSPPYLFKGTRPTITGAPAEAAYGATIEVATPDAAQITKVSLIRLGSTTHAFDMNQRFQWLSFLPGSGALAVTLPANRNDAPPGHYLLFILNGNGVPSTAAIIKLGADATPPPNVAPTADFTASCPSLSCAFTDKSVDTDGNVTAWNWSFGDGTGSTQRSPSHTFAAGGIYTVTLTATDNDGGSQQRSKRVSAPPTITLSVTTRSDTTKQYMTLTWSGANGAMVDVYRNGPYLTTTENDGKYTNSRTFTGTATYVYKVCEAGTLVCSNEATAKFP